MTLFPPILAIFDVGGGELVLIGLVALLLFGGDLPKVMRQVGRVVGDLRRQAESLTSEFRDEAPRSSYTPPRIKRPVDAPPTYPVDSTRPVETPAATSLPEAPGTSTPTDGDSSPLPPRADDDSPVTAPNPDGNLGPTPTPEDPSEGPYGSDLDSKPLRSEPPPSP